MTATTKKFAVAALLIIGAVSVFVYFRPASAKSNSLSGREQALEMLGQSIAAQRSQAKVLVLANPFAKESSRFDEKSQFDNAGIRGLTKGLGEKGSVTVVYPEIRPEYRDNPGAAAIPADTRTPLSFLIVPSSVNQVATEHPECDVIVSLIGLPLGVDQLKLWSEKDSRAFALLSPDLRILGPISAVQEAFRRGKLMAVVVEDLSTGTPVVVTKGNVGEIIRSQPKTLGF